MTEIDEVLTNDECDFILEVIKTPNTKIEVIGCPWLRPEALGFIERIGASKWIPTDKLCIKIFIKD